MKNITSLQKSQFLRKKKGMQVRAEPYLNLLLSNTTVTEDNWTSLCLDLLQTNIYQYTTTYETVNEFLNILCLTALTVKYHNKTK